MVGRYDVLGRKPGESSSQTASDDPKPDPGACFTEHS